MTTLRNVRSHPHQLVPTYSETVKPGMIPTNIIMLDARGRRCRVYIDIRSLTSIDEHAEYINAQVEGGSHLDMVVAQTSSRTGVPASAILNPANWRGPTSHARHEVMYRLATEFKTATGHRLYSTPDIAAMLGLRNHTSVIYGIRAHKRRSGIVDEPFVPRTVEEAQLGQAV